MKNKLAVTIGPIALALIAWWFFSFHSTNNEPSQRDSVTEQVIALADETSLNGSTGVEKVLERNEIGETPPTVLAAPLKEVVQLTGYAYCEFTGGFVDAIVELLDGKTVLEECVTGRGKPFVFSIPRDEVLGLRLKGGSLASGYIGYWNDDIYGFDKKWPKNVLRIGEVSGDQMTLDVPVFLPSGVEGVVLSEAGRPIAKATIHLSLSIENAERVKSTWAVADEMGRFDFHDLQPGIIGMKLNFLQVEDESLQKLMPPNLDDFQLFQGEVRDLGILYAVKGEKSITGTVVDQYGIPFVGLEVWAQPGDGDYGTSVSKAMTDKHGRYQLEGLVAGDFRVSHTQAAYGDTNRIPEEMIVGWWNHWVPAVLKPDVATLELGVGVVQRPEIYSVTLTYPIDSGKNYYPKVVVQEDAVVQALIKKAQEIGNYQFHAYDFALAPPWFNYKPHVDIQEETGVVKITCRLPHAPIRVELYANPGGRNPGRLRGQLRYKPSEIVLQPEKNALTEIALEEPTPR